MLLQLIAEENIDVDLVTIDGDSALIKACVQPNIEFVRTLVGAKAKMDTKNKHKNTALHYAVENNNLEIVTYLLDQGADPDIQNETLGNTPLILAADSGF